MIDKKYQELLQDILENGVEKKDRTGTGTISIFGRQIRHKMSDGFPLLTTKKMYWKGIVTELLWFLRGDTNIKFLVDNGCHIWDGDALKAYNKYEVEELKKLRKKYPHRLYKFALTTKEKFIEKIKTDDAFAKKWGDLGPIYGKQWRSWGGHFKEVQQRIHPKDGVPYSQYTQEYIKGIDQIANVIQNIKTNPDSRRHIVSAWNVGELDKMTLPPCHYGFQVYTRELSDEERLSWMKKNKSNVVLPMRELNVEFSIDEWFRPYGVPKQAISLMWNQRSVDTFLGLPFNIASYGMLLQMIAKEVNMIPDELIGTLGDVHLYKNHIEQTKEQLTREPFKLPKLQINDEFWNHEDSYLSIEQVKHMGLDDFNLVDYKSHPRIKAPLSN